MASNLLTPERDQLCLLLPSMADWLPEDHLAWFVLDALEEMDLSAFYADYRGDGWGGAAHDPATMVVVLLYTHCVTYCVEVPRPARSSVRATSTSPSG